ncbi:MAG: response regulator [Pseudotabrizicola sp.]|uniref:response regulator n=1 Tax=Pseudotabrizicola sp. TaxID=2939647 RepID=UPI00271F85D4|nr:response regulator [Pseudotabrizicola sp.]MDO9637696.1 response regulator [Pseudotabrizicola sp.]
MGSAKDVGVVTLVGGAMVAVFLTDLMFPLGTAVWLGYFLPLVLSFASSRPALPVAASGVMALALLAGFFLDLAGGFTATDAAVMDPAVAAANRSMAAAVGFVLGWSGHRLITSKIRLDAADWVQQGQVQVARAVQGELTLEKLGAQVLGLLAEKLGARAAVIYVRQGHGFERCGQWGGDAASLPQTIAEGDGHLTRAVQTNTIVSLKADPQTALGWGSGLLRGRAAYSVIIPTHDGVSCNGVIEIGLDHPLPEQAARLLERVGDKVGVAIRSAHYRSQLHQLLEESRRQAEELRSYSEELAATNEELEEQTVALKESQQLLEHQQSELEEQNAQLENQTQLLEEQRNALVQSRKSLEDQARTLERESRYKSEFVANMSHELRTPLNALLIMSRLLSENRGRTLTEEQVRWAQTIESSGQDLLTLINDILDLSKIEAGKLDLIRAEVDPQTVTRKLLRSFEVQARSKGLQLTAEVAPGIGVFQTDTNRLEQVLRNLLSNALKFTDRGRVSLRIAPVPDGVAFSVQDTGIGIADSEHEAVFDAFRQADGTISRRYGGTGLGLSISRELADLLGGTLTLASVPGQGSTFTLTLPRDLPRDLPAADAAGRMAAVPGERQMPAPPRAVAPADRAQVEAPRLTPLPGVTDDRDTLAPGDRVMLVVEDDPAFAQVMTGLAGELGFKCLCVGRADEAVLAARFYLPHAIVLDVGLPDHSGLSVLDQLKRGIATRHIPVHMVSAEDYIHEAMSQGAISYMLKPVQRDELAQAIQRLEQRLEQSVRRVLIVEDDPAQLEGLKALLGNSEVEAVGAATAAEALAAYRSQPVDCIVLDMTLPDASGFDLLEMLDSDDDPSFPPVIIYTARSLTEAEEQRLRRHSKSIIIKGAKSPERLIDEVTLFLHQVVSDLPEKQREMLAASLNRDAMLEGRRILVVEDDIRNVYALTGIFEPHGATVQIARNGREALEVLGRIADGAQPKIDLVLMDVMMPEMDGMTATREIRKIERWKTLPIIMLTAKAMADDQSQCLAAGANDYLSKPLDVDKLLSLARVWMPR